MPLAILLIAGLIKDIVVPVVVTTVAINATKDVYDKATGKKKR